MQLFFRRQLVGGAAAQVSGAGLAASGRALPLLPVAALRNVPVTVKADLPHRPHGHVPIPDEVPKSCSSFIFPSCATCLCFRLSG